MRKITSESTYAFECDRPFSKSNMQVTVDGDETKLFLFGNLIAKRINGVLSITNAGWQSNTTKERLNGLDGVSIQQKNHVWYLNGEEWNGSWKTIGEDHNSNSPLKAAAIVASMGELFAETPKEKNDWKKRMLNTQHGITFPEDFDDLPEEERTKRLDAAIEVGLEN